MIQRRKRRIRAGRERMLFFIEKKEHQYLTYLTSNVNSDAWAGHRRG
jgi:hypothetical protein